MTINTTERFTGRAETYAQHRPNYPEAYTNYLISFNQLTAGQTVADIGSGTGIFSQQLLDKQLNVFAVEPNADMRSIAEKKLNSYASFTSVHGTAEDTGLPDDSMDLVTVAQAFHWFDKPKFRKECQRILKPHAHVALVWNSRDSSASLVQENAKIFQQYCSDFNGFSGGMDENPHIFQEFFLDGQYKYTQFRADLSYDLEGFLGRNMSASYAPKPTDHNYKPFVEALCKLFDHHSEDGVLVMPNLIRSYIGRV